MSPFFFALWGRNGETSRSTILDIIRADPGIHVADLCARAKLAWSTASYHVRHMMRSGEIQAVKAGREVYLYAAEVPALHRPWFAALRDPDITRVLCAVLDGCQAVPALSANLGISQKIIRRCLGTLEDSGLVGRRGELRPRYEPLMPDARKWLNAELSRPDARQVEPAGLPDRRLD